MQHIYSNILLEWFQDKHLIKRTDDPIKAPPNYEYELGTYVSLTPEERIYPYEETDYGLYNHTIDSQLTSI